MEHLGAYKVVQYTVYTYNSLLHVKQCWLKIAMGRGQLLPIST